MLDAAQPAAAPAPSAVAGLQSIPRREGRQLRVMVVDDAVVVRGLVSRWLSQTPGIEVVSSHRTGAEAVAAVERVKPDVCILDLEMPEMDGLTALPLLLARKPGLSVIVSSTLTERGAEISLRCLSMGATDYIAKPSTNREVTISTDFRQALIDKVMAIGQRSLRGAIGLAAALRPPLLPQPSPSTLRGFGRGRTEIVVIGASTGGPNAILELLGGCRAAIQRVPLVIAQHMPATFTTMFAEHLRRRLTIDASEAENGELVEPGRVYVAPGGKHLIFTREAGRVRIRLDSGPPVNFCRPAVDVTFASAARVYGSGVLGVVLTGMGSDGLKGATDIVEAGGSLLAQDEATSVVWGMPGTVTRAGLCAAVQPVRGLAATILERSSGVRG